VNDLLNSNETPLSEEGCLDARFRVLRELLARAGHFARREDLQGMSGVLFRTYWHLRSNDSSPRRWSSRSGDACSGNPLARAAEAFGFRLVEDAVDGSPQSGEGLFETSSATTVEKRIAFLRRSIGFGIEYYEENEFRGEGIFAAGTSAYEALLEDLAEPPLIFLPESGEEAVLLVPELAPGSVGTNLLAPFSLAAALRRSLRAFGSARARLVGYLDRAANFIDSSAAIPFFARESASLLCAAERIADPFSETRRSVLEADTALDALLGRKVLRAVRRDVAAAAIAYRKGIDRLRRLPPPRM
jgi:hypothetical protein